MDFGLSCGFRHNNGGLLPRKHFCVQLDKNGAVSMRQPEICITVLFYFLLLTNAIPKMETRATQATATEDPHPPEAVAVVSGAAVVVAGAAVVVAGAAVVAAGSALVAAGSAVVVAGSALVTAGSALVATEEDSAGRSSV